jgi:hypothetical protein
MVGWKGKEIVVTIMGGTKNVGYIPKEGNLRGEGFKPSCLKN